MSGAAIITALLLADAVLLDLLLGEPDRLHVGVVPQNAPLPAVAIGQISGNPRNTLSSHEASVRRRERIQVTVLAKSYVEQRALIQTVRRACQYQRGTLAGMSQASVLPDLEGPDLRLDDPGIYMQTHDFTVSFNEPR